MIFFTISGYLVTESWRRDPHIVRFVARRMLRLWPGLAVATVVIVLVGATLSTLPLSEYFGHDTQQFLTRNLALRQAFHLPGVFEPPSTSAVNGSWWTIRLETKCYLYLGLLGLVGLRRRWLPLLALALVIVRYVKTLPGHPDADAFQNLYALYVVFFFTGVCLRQFRAELLRFRMPWGLSMAAIATLAVFKGWLPLAEWAVLPTLVLAIGSMSTPGLRSAGRLGDLSYGIYLYAYFVQQIVIRHWPGTPSFAGTLALSILVTSMTAWCSWHLVEAPALGAKRHLRRWFPDQAV